MAGKVTYAKQARQSLVEIYRYIAIEQQSPENADSFLTYLEKTVFEMLNEQPKIGRLWQKNTRFIVVKRYVILYEVLTDGVLVLDVIAPGTNWR